MIELRFKRRQETPQWINIASSFLTVIAALFVGSFFLLAIDLNPIIAYWEMFRFVFTPRGMSEVLVRTIPLALVGLAIYIPLKADLWNIAGDAQIYFGGIFAMWVGLNLDASSYILIPTMILAGAIGGSTIGLIPGYLRAKWNVSEILVTFMLTFAAVFFNEFAIRALAGDFVIHGSAPLPVAGHFPRLPGTRIHLGILFVIIALIFTHFLLNRTKYGFEIRTFGDNPEAARQSGMNDYKIIIGAFLIAGVLGGIAGAGEIGGIHRRLQPEFSPGFGFAGIAIALLGRNGVIQLFFASILFGMLYAGGFRLETTFDVPFGIVDVLEALVILFLIAAVFFQKYRISFKLNRPSRGEF